MCAGLLLIFYIVHPNALIISLDRGEGKILFQGIGIMIVFTESCHCSEWVTMTHKNVPVFMQYVTGALLRPP